MSRPDLPMTRRDWLTRSAGLVALAFGGCGYMIGAPYSPEIRTIHVPIFKSTSRRRGYEYQLTEAVQSKIKSRTPFRIAREDEADTRLLGKITSVEKRVLGQSSSSDARELQLDIVVEVTWEDVRTGETLRSTTVPAADLVRLQAQGDFAVEIGQSRATADQQVIDRLATRIVEMLESPW
jgi:hypothetical protein